MPIYEYKCRKCNKEFEAFQGITEPSLKSCRFCKGPVSKLMSRTTFHLKGSGWYVTDYGGQKAPPTETKTEASSSSSDAPSTPAEAPAKAAGSED